MSDHTETGMHVGALIALAVTVALSVWAYIEMFAALDGSAMIWRLLVPIVVIAFTFGIVLTLMLYVFGALGILIGGFFEKGDAS